MFLLIEVSDIEAIDIIRRNRFVTVDEFARAETLAELVNAIANRVNRAEIARLERDLAARDVLTVTVKNLISTYDHEEAAK